MNRAFKLQFIFVILLFCLMVYLLFWGAMAEKPLSGKVIAIQYCPSGGRRVGGTYSVTIKAENGLTNVIPVSRIEAEMLRIGDFYSRENGYFKGVQDD